MGAMSEKATYTVSGMSCGHCVAAVTAELQKLDGGPHGLVVDAAGYELAG